MSDRDPVVGRSILLPMMGLYGVAGLMHFVHNAVYLHDYPNLPPWLTSTGICAACRL